MKVRCPNCRIEIEYEGNPHRPFCSHRCRLIDLGEWASESYRVPVDHHISAENLQEQAPHKSQGERHSPAEPLDPV